MSYVFNQVEELGFNLNRINQTLTGYHNGIVVGTAGSTTMGSSSVNIDANNHFYIGAYNNSAGTGTQADAYLDGEISEVLIFDHY